MNQMWEEENIQIWKFENRAMMIAESVRKKIGKEKGILEASENHC